MTQGVQTAIILAAGMGTRLQSLHTGLPKGMLRIGDQTLIERSLRCLQSHGIQRILLVIGAHGEAYRQLVSVYPHVECIENAAFATTGSMASLACAIPHIREDFLLLESDLFYEFRAIAQVQQCPHRDVVLASGETAATDEVWVDAPQHWLRGLSKSRHTLNTVQGEFVGILKISYPLAQDMAQCFYRFTREHGHGNMSYETDALVQAAQQHPVWVELVSDLLWGEIDNPYQYNRVINKIWPHCYP